MRKLFEEILNEIIAEQNGKDPALDVTGKESIYTPDQQKFLAHFGKTQNQSLGILYSLSPSGIQEFLNRSGALYNLTSDVLVQLLKLKVISIVPYTGYSRNTDYTIKCNVPTKEFADFSTAEEEPAAGGGGGAPAGGGDTGGFTGGGGMTTADLDAGGGGGAEPPAEEEAGEPVGAEVPEEGAEVPAPDEGAPEESFRKDGTLLTETDDIVHTQYTYPQIVKESIKIAKQLMTSYYINENFFKRAASSRVLNRLPKGYLILLERIIVDLSKKMRNNLDKEHLVADILDNLAHNFGLTPNQILKSYTFYKHQNRLKNLVKK